jgi:hypothetical protein
MGDFDPRRITGLLLALVAAWVSGSQIYSTVLLLRIFRSPSLDRARWSCFAVCMLGWIINFTLAVLVFSFGLFSLVGELPSGD